MTYIVAQVVIDDTRDYLETPVANQIPNETSFSLSFSIYLSLSKKAFGNCLSSNSVLLLH
ncbi:hypothetical protein AXX17_AT2G30150 [Arabidopsis thaliana]|uniref:Uncharacterized protein n=1 Tax=Arabidopsis thaliana TaxID=3702 RepID=A0A178VX15_ARATH|nr:hypothetical protein AXX17_AT2G30150 [Arabidopsis thaliana]